MSEDEFNGIRYRFGRMDAMKQFHVTRRLAPLVTRMGEVDFAALLPPKPAEGEDVAKPNMLGKLQPIAEALSLLPDADCEYIINAAMSVVTREQGPTFVAVWHKGVGRPMFDDIDMLLMLNLTARTLMENLSGFFPAPAST